jgi:hypothetical protein
MSIVRLQSLYTISVGTDTSMDGVLIALYTAVELNVAIICASLPANKALIQRIFPRLLSSNRGRSTNGARTGYANMDGSTVGGSALESGHKMRSLTSQNRNKYNRDYKDEAFVDVRTDIEISSLDGSQTNLTPGRANGGTFLADCWSQDSVTKPTKGREAV